MTMKNISGLSSQIKNNSAAFDTWTKYTQHASSIKMPNMSDIPEMPKTTSSQELSDDWAQRKTKLMDGFKGQSSTKTATKEDLDNELRKFNESNNQNIDSTSQKMPPAKLSQANQSSQSILGLIGGSSGNTPTESQAANTESVASPPKKLQQASISKLSQANQTPQRVLGLIGGDSGSAQAEPKVASTEEIDPEAIDPQPVQRGGSVDIAG